MKLFNFLKIKRTNYYEEPLQNNKKIETSSVELIPIIENCGLKITLKVDGLEKDWLSLSNEEQDDISTILYENSMKKKSSESNKEIIIDGDLVSIPKIDFYGFNPVYSENNEYMICSTDGHLEFINDKDVVIKGSIVACKAHQLLFHKKVSRPNDCKVSNNGIFITNNWINYTDLCGSFLIFDIIGEKIFEKKINANLYNNGISPNGKYACFQTCNSDHIDGFKLFLVDIGKKEIISSFNPITSYADSYIIDESKEIILFCYKNKDYSYTYKFDGTFLDYDKFENIKFKEALNDDYGYNLKNIAFNKLLIIERKCDLTIEDYSEFIDLIGKSLEKEMSDYNKATCHRKLGKIYEIFNLLDKALDNYNKAVEHYPKIGVKRKITSISKLISE